MRPYAFTVAYALAAIVAGVAVGEAFMRRRATSSSSSSSTGSTDDNAAAASAVDVISRIADTFNAGVSYVKNVVGITWAPPASAAPYLEAIERAEVANGIPHWLFARLLEQESHYRADIISGAVISGAGAVGIAQLVPRWHPGVDPRDPFASIAYAARYLAQLKRQLGTWDKALGAYNWGPSKVQTAVAQFGDEWLASAPAETRSYVERITADVPITEGVLA